MSEIVKLEIDWAEEFGWKCPLCGGEIDHHSEKDNLAEKIVDDSYQCQDKGGGLCERAYFMVQYSLVERGDNGDALTLKRWIEFEV